MEALTMPIPTPPAPGANNGGFLILSYSNGIRTHRVRFYVAPFNASTGTYNTAQGTETNVSTTAAALRGNLTPFYTAAWTFHWAALYQHVGGVPQEIPLTATVADAAGTNAGSAGAFPEGFYCFNSRSTLLGRAKFFLIEPAGWTYQAPLVESTAGSAPFGALVTYLTGSNTGVVCHDGGRFISPFRVTVGLNKKLRARAGHA